MTRVCILTIAILLGALSPLWAESADEESPEEVTWDMESFARVIKPMQHSMEGRLPLLLWNFPIPRGEERVELRQSGKLREYIEIMAERGMLPTVEMGWNWTPEGAMAMAQTLQEAGKPVHVLVPWIHGGEEGLYANCTVWVEGSTTRERVRQWPCLPLYDPSQSQAWLKDWMQRFKAAGVEVRAVWFDYEALPHPWNGVEQAMRKSEECRQHFPPGALDDRWTFQEYVYNLRAQVLSEAMVDPVKEIFPDALVSNYSEVASSAAVRTFGWLMPCTIGRLDAIMPSAYAGTRDLSRHFEPGEEVTQEKADRIYFYSLVQIISTANANKAAGKLSIPYISRFSPDIREERFLFGMTSARYRELVRHLLLRGADSFYLYNLGNPRAGQIVTPAMSFESVEDARAVYDELLEYREFLDQGQVMNYDFPPLHSTAPVWSGLRLADSCLVRTYTLGEETVKVIIMAFPGVPVQLEVPPEGATYLIHSDGAYTKVEGEK